MDKEDKFDVEVVNRFTGKIYEVYRDMSISGVFNIQDEYLLHLWKKVDVYKIGV